MDGIMTIMGIAATGGIVAAAALGMRWVLSDHDDSWTFDDARAASIAYRWPVGIQEEEPFRWRVEALGPRARSAPHEPTPARTGTRVSTPPQPRTTLGLGTDRCG